MTQTYILPERLDTAVAPGLAEALLARRNTPITLDAAGVESAGTLGLQVLVAAARQWHADACAFKLNRPSDALLSACETLGIGLRDIGCPEVE